MKAAQIVAPQRIEIVEVPKPDMSSIPVGNLLVKTCMTSICGSDMPDFSISLPADRYPLPPGYPQHECIGTVVASNSKRFREGDAVVALPHGTAGMTEYFLSHEGGTLPLAPFDRKECLVVAQPLGTVIWALRKLGNLLNKDAVVLGQGPLGLLFTAMLSNLGARTIVALDLLDHRLEVSRAMRATHVVNASRANPVEVVREVTEGRMADLVVEAVGHQIETVNTCPDLLKRCGTLLSFGVPDDEFYSFRFTEVFRKNITLIGSVGLDIQNDIALAISLITQGRVDVLPIISHILPFTEAQRAFDLALHKNDGAVKIVLKYS